MKRVNDETYSKPCGKVQKVKYLDPNPENLTTGLGSGKFDPPTENPIQALGPQVCALCFSPAEWYENESVWRHAGLPWEKDFLAQNFCDRYGYPIPIRPEEPPQRERQGARRDKF